MILFQAIWLYLAWLVFLNQIIIYPFFNRLALTSSKKRKHNYIHVHLEKERELALYD